MQQRRRVTVSTGRTTTSSAKAGCPALAGGWGLPVSPAPLSTETLGLNSSFSASCILLSCTPVAPDVLPGSSAFFLLCCSCWSCSQHQALLSQAGVGVGRLLAFTPWLG